ncbi:MAG TPA: hypothetical protein VHF07_03215 [Nitrospiraceae bacterium]|nr:hypothetical protein [Nitrospiraceae bacterium]
MAERFFSIPREIIRLGGSLSSGGNNASAELPLVDLGKKKAFMLHMAGVWILEDSPIEQLSAWMVVRDAKDAPVASMPVPIFPSARLRSDGSGIFTGTVQGPIPVKAGEKLCFQIQWKAGTGTLSFHANAWGYVAN